ncbi:MAG: flagellar basal-body MS-ring/collar protein FliF [Bacillota bacterium]|nr:flagellar basal-body MS-ring/collar protein FliF [Bacillota bacterium]
MAAIGQDLGRRTRSLWDQMTSSQKLMVLLAIALGVVAMVLLLSRTGKTEMVPLYTGLSAGDAADIVAKLREMRIPYEISDGGATIRVPFDNVYETRMNLASQGLPSGGTVGFEIFDKTNFGATDFTQKMNYRRALQGELTRTILQLREVEEARVHIAIPEPALYIDEQKPPTASVMVKLRSGATLTRGQVQGIVRLVSSSVEGLNPSNVTVLDVDGNILYAASDETETGLMTSLSVSQLEAKRAYEKDLEKSVESMLTEVLGPRKVVVRVNTEINFDRREQNSEVFQPMPTGLGVIREQTKVHEVRSTAVAPPAGVPGTASNVDVQGAAGGATGAVGIAGMAGTTDSGAAQIQAQAQPQLQTPGQAALDQTQGASAAPGAPVPGLGGSSTTAGAVSGAAGATGTIGTGVTSAAPPGAGVYRTGQRTGEVSGEERSEETTRYEISRVVEHTVKAPGEVRRLSVAAMVAAPLSDAQLQAITRSIGAAVGIDPGRGDSLIVEPIEFGAPLTSDEEAGPGTGAAAAKERVNLGEVVMANMEYVLAAIIGLFLVGLVISVVRQRAPARPAVVPALAAPHMPVAAGEPGASVPVAAAREEERAEKEGGAGRQAQEVAVRPAPNAEIAARVISGWMDEDKR